MSDPTIFPHGEPPAAAQPANYEAEKRCCSVCDGKKLCSICQEPTLYACADCRIDFGVTIYVCEKAPCRDDHELKCSARLRERLQAVAPAAALSPTKSEAERTVESIAAMLGWMNVPPRETLERDIAALKARSAALSPSEEPVDEEMVPHTFVPMSSGDGNGEAGSADEEIWCANCEYHRDHDIHKASAPLSPAAQEKQDASKTTRPIMPAAVSEVREVQLRPDDELQRRAAVQTEQKGRCESVEDVQGLSLSPAPAPLKELIEQAIKEIEWWVNEHGCCAGHEAEVLAALRAVSALSPQPPTCSTCAHLTPFELTVELLTCPVVNIRIHRESATVFGCNQHEAKS